MIVKQATSRESKKPVAVFTICQDEFFFLPIWLSYYSRQFGAENCYVLDHDNKLLKTKEGTTGFYSLPCTTQPPRSSPFINSNVDFHTLCAILGANAVPVHNRTSWNHDWLCRTVEAFQRFLLQSYEVVIFVEADEILCFQNCFHDGRDSFTLGDALHDAAKAHGVIQAKGYQVVQDLHIDLPIDLSKPLLDQGRMLIEDARYNKPIVASRPVYWNHGFHSLAGMAIDEEPQMSKQMPLLSLLHLHYLDYGVICARNESRLKRNWDPAAIKGVLGQQNRITPEKIREEFEQWQTKKNQMMEIRQEWKGLIPPLL